MEIAGQVVFCPKCKSEDIGKQIEKQEVQKVSMDNVYGFPFKAPQLRQTIRYALVCHACGYRKAFYDMPQQVS